MKEYPKAWKKGNTSIAVVMITLNEAHNIEAALDSLEGWATEVHIVDSYSSDETVELALRRGVNVVQRNFTGFGDQWNYALKLPETANWVMKMDPDERVSQELKDSITKFINSADGNNYALYVKWHLYFMRRPLPVSQNILRVWRRGTCKFTNAEVNEHPVVDGTAVQMQGSLEHHDSPNMHHWFVKQNRYTTTEARAQVDGKELLIEPKFFGSKIQRRMWIKKNFWRIPFRFFGLFGYHYFYLGAWKAGVRGFYWSQLRTFVYWQWQIKAYEMRLQKDSYRIVKEGHGNPDPRVKQADC